MHRKFPRYKEFTMQEFWINVDGDPKILSYLPDRGSQSKPITRTFAFTVLNTLRPGFSKEVVDHAMDHRANKINTKLSTDIVTINDEWLKKLTGVAVKPGKYKTNSQLQF